jgi:uncharacterized membrane protein YraQ (UPF0718 family)
MDEFPGVAMVSTMIAVLLAGAVILWNAPFSIRPILRAVHRRRRGVLLAVLLTTLGAVETHTSIPSKQAADFGNKKQPEECKRS